MSERDAVLHAFEEWWSIIGGSLLASYRSVEPQAFFAGAAWQRERDAEIAESTISNDGGSWDAACSFIAEQIRKG